MKSLPKGICETRYYSDLLHKSSFIMMSGADSIALEDVFEQHILQ